MSNDLSRPNSCNLAADTEAPLLPSKEVMPHGHVIPRRNTSSGMVSFPIRSKYLLRRYFLDPFGGHVLLGRVLLRVHAGLPRERSPPDAPRGASCRRLVCVFFLGGVHLLKNMFFDPVGFKGNRFHYWTYVFPRGLKHMEGGSSKINVAVPTDHYGR